MARKKGDCGDSQDPRPQRDPRDVRIERLERDKAKLIEERDRWKRRSEHLQKELEAARRAGRRQAAPFAKDRPQGSGRRPGRRAGAEYGKHGCRRPPARVDETYSAPAPTACPDCGGAVALDRVAAQYPEELPDVRPLVRRFDIGWATASGVGVACGAGTRCRPPTRWARPPPNWTRTSPRWSVAVGNRVAPVPPLRSVRAR